MKIGKIKIVKSTERKKIGEHIAKAFSLSFIRGKSILRINIIGIIIIYHDKRIVKVGFLTRKKILVES